TRRLPAVLFGWTSGNGVQPDVRHHLPLEGPHLVAAAVLHHLRRPIAPLRAQVPVEQIGRLHHVIVDAPRDQLSGIHGTTPPRQPTPRDSWGRPPPTARPPPTPPPANLPHPPPRPPPLPLRHLPELDGVDRGEHEVKTQHGERARIAPRDDARLDARRQMLGEQ